MMHEGRFAEGVKRRRTIRQVDTPPRGASVGFGHVVAGDKMNEDARLTSLMYE